MSDKSVVLMLESTEGGALEYTRSRLEESGLVIDEIMPLLKTITGTVSEGNLEQLKSIANVKHVREERGFSLPPMHERVPQ